MSQIAADDSMSISASSIGVAIRIRPFNSRECDRKDIQCWETNENASRLELTSEARNALKEKVQNLKTEGYTSPDFGGNSCFDRTATTMDIYEAVGKRVVTGSLGGVNGTILAYGQTSSGKTHTMLGDQNHPGVVLLAVRDVFKHINEDDERHFLLRMSMCEIYNEVVADLLKKDNKPLNVFTAPGGRNVVIKNITEETVTSPEQVWQLLDEGFKNRSVSGTDMNAVSSRSHTVIRLVIQSRKVGATKKDKTRKSTLNMVDLAGSERMSQAGTSGKGQRLKEGININRSLLTLGTVIKKLMKAGARGVASREANGARRKKRPMHIPYRNSMLTRVLAKSLGGNAQTGVICTLAPSQMYYADSRITLNFAANACKVKVKARVNEVKKEDSELGIFQDVAQQLKAQLRALPAQGAWPSGANNNVISSVSGTAEVNIVPGSGPGGVLPGSAEFEAAALASAEEKTAELRDELQEKIKHLESLILCANKSSGVNSNTGENSNVAGSNLPHKDERCSSVIKKSSRKCRRLTVSGGDVARSWARTLIQQQYNHSNVTECTSPFRFFRKLGTVPEADSRNSCGSESSENFSDSEESISQEKANMTLPQALEEIDYLLERVDGEEQDRIQAEEQVFNLQMELAMLRDGAGIREMTEKELGELYDFHEEGMLRIVEERNFRKSKFSQLQKENAELRRQLAQAKMKQEMMPSSEEYKVLAAEKENLQQQLDEEKQHRIVAELKLSEECNRLEAEKRELHKQALEQEKITRAWHKLDKAKLQLQHESIVSQCSPVSVPAKAGVLAPHALKRQDVESGAELKYDENKKSMNIKENYAKKLNSSIVKSKVHSKAPEAGIPVLASTKTLSFSPSSKISTNRAVGTPTMYGSKKYQRTPMRGFFDSPR